MGRDKANTQRSQEHVSRNPTAGSTRPRQRHDPSTGSVKEREQTLLLHTLTGPRGEAGTTDQFDCVRTGQPIHEPNTHRNSQTVTQTADWLTRVENEEIVEELLAVVAAKDEHVAADHRSAVRRARGRGSA